MQKNTALHQLRPLLSSLLLASFALLAFNACSGGNSKTVASTAAPPPVAETVISPPPAAVTPLYGNKAAGMWLWDTNNILSTGSKLSNADKSNVSALIAFCQQKQVTEIFLQINRDIAPAKYQYLLSTLKAARVNTGYGISGISVQALDGASNWTVAAGDARKYAFMDWVFAYQKTATANQRFTAIQFDVEPYTADLWKNDLPAGILAYQNFVTDALQRITAKNTSDGLGLGMAVAIPFWYDERTYSNSYGNGNLAEWVYQKVDIVAVMSYRDTSGPLFDVAKNELAYGAQYHKPSIIGAETSLQEPAYVSFYEEGEAAMLTVLNQVVTSISLNNSTAAAPYRFGIHDYKNWKTLPVSPR